MYEDFIGDAGRATSVVYCQSCEQYIPTNSGGVHTCTCAREARGEECTLDGCNMHSMSKKTDKAVKDSAFYGSEAKNDSSAYNSTQEAVKMSVQSAQRRGILEFVLPDESCSFKIAVNSMDFVLALHEFDNWLRAQIKHNPDGLSDEQQELLETVRQRLHDELSDYNVSLDMLE